MNTKILLNDTSYLEGNYNILELIQIIIDKYNKTNMEIDYLFNQSGELYINIYNKDNVNEREDIKLHFD